MRSGLPGAGAGMSGEPDMFDAADASEGDDEGTPSGFFQRAAALGEGRRRPGRPEGARNRKSVDFERWFYAKGYTDPAQILAEISSMDVLGLQALAIENAAGLPRQLAKDGDGIPTHYVTTVPSIVELLELKRKAAGDLMPYLHGKKPNQEDEKDERLPRVIIVTGDNQLAQAGRIAAGKALRLGTPLLDGEAKEIKDLADAEADSLTGSRLTVEDS